MASTSFRSVIITGASSGIGAALAREFAQRGAALGLIARRKPELMRLAAEFATPSEVYAADVRDSSALNSMAAHFLARHGCPDAVIANAGVSIGTLTECAKDALQFRSVIETNVDGIVNTFRPFLAPMRRAGRGTLVGIASVAGYRGLPGSGAYSASKAAVISYLESLRLELKPCDIRVVTICPGFVGTPMTEVNPYPMPFMMDAGAAACRIADLAERGRVFTVIPWQMAVVARALHVMPHWLYGLLFSRAPRKPRRPD